MRLGKALLPILLVTVFSLGGCAGSGRGEGFAIYLLKDNVPPAQLPALSHIELADEPIIATPDIISYEADTHRITLTPAASTRVRGLKVPTSGLSFAACVNGAPVYTGAFWIPISSQSFGGVTIMQTMLNSGDSITISLGYPGSGFFTPGRPDPRSDDRVIDALREAGKLL
jgi:hypothetical protein